MTQTTTTPIATFRRGGPAAMTTTVHIGSEHVAATDLTAYHRGTDLVSLTLGDETAKVVLLGSLAEMRSILATASGLLDAVDADRCRPGPSRKP